MATSTIPQRLVDETPVPEQHYLPPTEYCPNNPMPIIIYRNFFKEPRDADAIQAYVENNKWDKKVRLVQMLVLFPLLGWL